MLSALLVLSELVRNQHKESVSGRPRNCSLVLLNVVKTRLPLSSARDNKIMKDEYLRHI